jgi:hypothetical protein
LQQSKLFVAPHKIQHSVPIIIIIIIIIIIGMTALYGT